MALKDAVDAPVGPRFGVVALTETEKERLGVAVEFKTWLFPGDEFDVVLAVIGAE